MNEDYKKKIVHERDQEIKKITTPGTRGSRPVLVENDKHFCIHIKQKLSSQVS